MWLGSQMKFIFLVYLRIKSTISVRRFGLLILLPDDIACRELSKSLNMQISSFTVLMIQSKANLIAVSSAANIDILSVNLTLRSIFNFGTQNAAKVLSAKVLDASV